jgi:hypothetical protein
VQKQITAGCTPYFCPSSSPRSPFHLLPHPQRSCAHRWTDLATLMTGMAIQKSGLAKSKHAARQSCVTDATTGSRRAESATGQGHDGPTKSPYSPSRPRTRNFSHEHATFLPSQTSAKQTNSSHKMGGLCYGGLPESANLVTTTALRRQRLLASLVPAFACT